MHHDGQEGADAGLGLLVILKGKQKQSAESVLKSHCRISLAVSDIMENWNSFMIKRRGLSQ